MRPPKGQDPPSSDRPGTGTRGCNVLLVYPRFTADTFWSLGAACEVLGVRRPSPPLGLITVAALLPSHWTARLVDRNIEELTSEQLAWADLVMTGGMLPQQHDTLVTIDLCHAHGRVVAVGGPGVTSVPEVYASADFRVLGEAEGIIDKFIEAWEGGARSGDFEAEKFSVDVTESPVPRFDLIQFEHYLNIGIQFSRGCPFTCEFCDIIELYGRVPRAKTTQQFLRELDELHRLGYRGPVDLVDDNLIGDKKAVRALMPELRRWLEEHDFPFEFTTEASVNLADDEALLRAMSDANFVQVFMGIESPDMDTLVATKKKQNTRRSLVESVHKFYDAGIIVTAGFIVGFDGERGSVAQGMIELIEEASIPVCMVGLLYALPNTQLTRRLDREGRLHLPIGKPSPASGDQCFTGLNFDTKRSQEEVLHDYRTILEKVYDPVAYAGRLERLMGMLDSSSRRRNDGADVDHVQDGVAEMMTRFVESLPEPRSVFWPMLKRCMAKNPRWSHWIIALTAFYLHLGPFSRKVIGQIDARTYRPPASVDSSV